MIATWLLYAALLGVLASLGAMAAERAARALRRPRRMVWAGACALTLLGPIAAYVVATQTSAPLAAQLEPSGPLTVTPSGQAPNTRTRWRLAAIDAWVGQRLRAVAPRVNQPLALAWILATLLLLTRLTASIVRMRSRRASWATREVDGTPVLVSSDVGPAVIGLRSMHIVMPEWSLALDAPLREVVLRHEAEHRRAGDPYLLFSGALACALVPWNVALWWQVRRLRLAIEIDCDARVLRDDPQVDRYGTLLLAIAQRRAARIPAAIAALTESRSDLERRIEAMTNPSRRSRLIALACAGAALIAIAFACEAPVPAAPIRSAAGAPAAAVVSAPTGFATNGASRNDPCGQGGAVSAIGLASVARSAGSPAPSNSRPPFYYSCEVSQAATLAEGNTAPAYPATLRAANVEGRVDVSFVVDTNGRIDAATVAVVRSSDQQFTDAVLAHLGAIRFIPARLAGAKVPQAVELPFAFALNGRRALTARRAAAMAYLIARGVPSSPPSAAVDGSTSPDTGHGRIYLQSEVDKPASVAEGNTAPTYPAVLRAGNIEGRVLVSFVVDTNGMADTSTFKVIKLTHDLFAVAVREHLLTMRFIPAEKGGQRVSQLVQMPFTFTLGK